MKKILLLLFVVALVAAVAWLWYWFNCGVSNKDVCDVVCGESAKIQDRIDRRHQELDRKLYRIEGKLDRLLKIADRPFPDGMQKAD